MKLGIFLQHYFPYGGLQRDAVRLAQAAKNAGHDPVLTVSSMDGDIPEGIQLEILACGGSSNHSKAAKFAKACQQRMEAGEYDTAICFSRVPDTPFHFCGDPCFKDKFERTKSSVTRLLPRYRFLLENELNLFGPTSHTHVFFLAASEIPAYQKYYPVPDDQYTLLPPWLNQPVDFPESDPTIKLELTSGLGIASDDKLLLFVGSDFHRKGLDRAIHALASTQNTETHLIVCGQDKAAESLQLAKSLHIEKQVHLLGPRDDVPRWMKVGDALVHPARQETAGMVLLEALTYGLPVICTSLCGYATHVQEAGGTLLSPSPTTEELASAIRNTLDHQPELKEMALKWTADPGRYNTADLMLKKMYQSLS